MKKIVSAFLISSILATSGFSIEKSNINVTMEKNVNNIFNILSNNNIQDKKSEIFKSIDSYFDFTLMSKLVIGKKHWTSFNKEQQKIFVENFEIMLKNFYYNKFLGYSNQKFEILKSNETKENQRISLITNIIDGNKNYEIIFKFYNKVKNASADWLIYDVEIEGVSIVKVYSEQLNELFNSNSFNDAINKIKELDKK